MYAHLLGFYDSIGETWVTPQQRLFHRAITTYLKLIYEILNARRNRSCRVALVYQLTHSFMTIRTYLVSSPNNHVVETSTGRLVTLNSWDFQTCVGAPGFHVLIFFLRCYLLGGCTDMGQLLNYAAELPG